MKIAGLYGITLANVRGIGYNWSIMTVLVGITTGANVYIGADRAASDGDTISTMYHPKVAVKDGWIFAYAGSIGTGQLLQHIDFPDIESSDDTFYLVRFEIMPAYKNYIEEYGSGDDDNSAEILIGGNGRLFDFTTSDWGVTECWETAGGSGNQIALGSLYTTSLLGEKDTYRRIELALAAAIEHSPSCQGPYDILSI